VYARTLLRHDYAVADASTNTPFESLDLPPLHFFPFFFSYPIDPQDLHSFPTRRSSDLRAVIGHLQRRFPRSRASGLVQSWTAGTDRKSTRLNSSHVKISYAVFCLKKKKKDKASSTLDRKIVMNTAVAFRELNCPLFTIE